MMSDCHWLFPLPRLPHPPVICFLPPREDWEAGKRAASTAREEVKREACNREMEAAARENDVQRKAAKEEATARRRAASKEEDAKWEAAKREAARRVVYDGKREAAREDAKRADAREEAARRETAAKEAAGMEAAAKQKAWMELVKKATTKREMVAKEAITRMEAAAKENAQREAAKEAATKREAGVQSRPKLGSAVLNGVGSASRYSPLDKFGPTMAQSGKEKCVKKMPTHESVLKNDDERSWRHPSSLLKSLLHLALLLLVVFLVAYICSSSSITFQTHGIRSVLEICISVPHSSRFSFGKLMLNKFPSTSFHMLTRSSRLPHCSIHMTGCECGDPACIPT